MWLSAAAIMTPEGRQSGESSSAETCLEAREIADVLEVIQRNFLDGNFKVTLHFLHEMRNDLIFFVDIQHAILEADSLSECGVDGAGNQKCEVLGSATDGRSLGIICSLRQEDNVLLITVYEIKRRG